MSISSKVSATTSDIRAISKDSDNFEWQKSEAVSSAQSIESEWREIARLARTAKAIDGEIIATAQSAEEALKSALAAARARLEDQMNAARDAMNAAQRDFDTAATALVSGFENSIRTMSTTKSENDGIHDDIIGTAS